MPRHYNEYQSVHRAVYKSASELGHLTIQNCQLDPMAFFRYLMFHVQECVPEMGMLSSCRSLLCCHEVAFVPAKRPMYMCVDLILAQSKC